MTRLHLRALVERWDVLWDAFEGRLYNYFGRGPIRRAVRTVFLNLLHHHGVQLASAMAFDLFLALIPLLALAGWVVSRVVRGDARMLHKLSLWLDLTPADVRDVVNQHAERFFGGTLAPIALLGALWLASGAFYTVMAAFERTVPSAERSWWLRRALALLCVLVLLAALSLVGWVFVGIVGGGFGSLLHLEAQPSGLDTAQGLGLIVSFVIMLLLVAGFFRVGVRRDVPVRRVWPGAALTVLIGGAASYLFAEYARTLAGYAFYYGSLAAVAVLLAWLWMCSMALLLGAELNVYLEEHHRNSLRPPPASLP